MYYAHTPQIPKYSVLCYGMRHPQWQTATVVLCLLLQTPYITEPPPLLEGWRLQDGVSVDAELHGTMLEMIRQMNRGVYTLKDIPLTTK